MCALFKKISQFEFNWEYLKNQMISCYVIQAFFSSKTWDFSNIARII